MNHAMHVQAEDRRKHILVLLERLKTEWVSTDYLRHRLDCTKQQVRRDVELLKDARLIQCCQLLDLRVEGIGVSDDVPEKPKTLKVAIVKLTSKGDKKAKTLPTWIVPF